MELEQFKKTLAQIRKGSYHTVVWKSEPKVRAAFKNIKVEKITQGVVRIGVSYANMKPIKEAGLGSGSLPYGEWDTEMHNIIIHSNNRLQVRLTKTLNPKHRAHSRWFVDGVETSIEDIEASGMLYPRSANDSPIFNIKLENLLEIKPKKIKEIKE